MNLLREYIRQLLTEAARGPADLPPGFGVAIIDYGSEEVDVLYYDPTENQSTETPTGYIQANLASASGDGDCRGSWVILGAEADSGWGPMLYDVLMEYISSVKDSSLAPDRAMVSQDAYGVWNYYANNRPDVKRHPLDFRQIPFITPNDEADDCDAESWDEDYRKFPLPKTTTMDGDRNPNLDADLPWKEDYLSSPINYTYYTEGTPMMDALRAAGKLMVTKR